MLNEGANYCVRIGSLAPNEGMGSGGGGNVMDKKKVGPAHKDVAAKYKGEANASGMLVSKLKEGKAHPKVNASDAELKAAVDTVLSAK